MDIMKKREMHSFDKTSNLKRGSPKYIITTIEICPKTRWTITGMKSRSGS